MLIDIRIARYDCQTVEQLDILAMTPWSLWTACSEIAQKADV